MTDPEIPEAAVNAATGVYGGPSGRMRTALAAALPHLRVQETRGAELADSARVIATRLNIDSQSIDRDDTRIAVQNSARDLTRLAELIEAPHPRPVVDREALAGCLHRAACMTSPSEHCTGPKEVDYVRADAVLALLPTEEAGHSVEETKRLTKLCYWLGQRSGRERGESL